MSWGSIPVNWVQEPDAEQDDGFQEALNLLLGSVTEAGAPPPLAGSSEAAEGEAMEEEGEQQPAPAPAAPVPAAPPASGSTGINASLLAAALGNILTGAAPAAQQRHHELLRQQLEAPSLSEVLRPERVGPLLDANPALAARLAPHLPEAFQTPAAIRQLISTSQFRHQVRWVRDCMRGL